VPAKKQSRQYLYRLRKKAEGKCVQCGESRDGLSKTHCRECAEKKRTLERKYSHFKPWKPGSKGRRPLWATEALADIESACGVEKKQKLKELMRRVGE
jgi:hypothetical protein